jgi:hypothetical protein
MACFFERKREVLRHKLTQLPHLPWILYRSTSEVEVNAMALPLVIGPTSHADPAKSPPRSPKEGGA